jgi:hypothetical protein
MLKRISMAGIMNAGVFAPEPGVEDLGAIFGKSARRDALPASL